jgi:hypothetical protein
LIDRELCESGKKIRDSDIRVGRPHATAAEQVKNGRADGREEEKNDFLTKN